MSNGNGAMHPEIVELRRFAEEQGWRVGNTSTGRVRFLAPDGKGQVVVGPNRGSGRAIDNAKAELRRAGLEIPHPREKGTPVREDSSPTVEEYQSAPKTGPSKAEVIGDALDASVQMLEELASDYAAFKSEVRGRLSTAETEAHAMKQHFPITVPAHHHDDRYVTPSTLKRALDEIGTKVAEAARKADPIAAFRARLKGTEK